MAKLRIEVTAADIAAGKKEDCQNCPVARALSRAAGYGSAWTDGYDFELFTLFTRDETGLVMGSVIGTLPMEAQNFVDDFDSDDIDRDALVPFTFEIDIPDTVEVKR